MDAREDSAVTLVAECDGAIVGFAAAGPCTDADRPDGWQLHAIYLLAAHHGTGLGQALITGPQLLPFPTDCVTFST